MMKCPVCGASNSIRRTICFQCAADFHAQAPSPTPCDPRACKNCAHATVSPAVGTVISGSQVWCLKLKTAKGADDPGGECFEASFAWRREESLD